MMKGITVSNRLLSFALALVMLVGACPTFALSSFANDGEDASEVKVWTDEDYAKLYVTDADGDGKSDLLFKWDAFDLEAGTVVTTLENQVANGASITLDRTFDGTNKVLIDTTAVSKVSDGTEKDTVLGDTGATNLVADSTVDTKGALLSTATLDFTAIQPTHTVGDVTVLDDVTLELTLFQQNYYSPEGTLLKSAATYGPLSNTRFIHDQNDMTVSGTQVANSTIPVDDSYGFVAHSTFGFTRKGTSFGAWHTDNARAKNHVFGNYRLQTYSVGIVFDYTVAEEATTGTFFFDYYRDAVAVNASAGYEGDYNALYCGNNLSSAPTAAHNKFWFGGNLPFAYRAIRMYSVALSDAQMAQNHAAELLDYYRVNLTDYNSLTGASRKEAISALKDLRLGQTSKEAIEAIITPIAEKAATEKMYEDLYVTDADGDGKSDLLFKWDAFDLEAGASVTVLENQVEGSNLTLDRTFDGTNKKLIATADVSKVSDGTEKNTVLGDTAATNLVADSTIDTRGAVLTTSTLDFSAIAPSHTVGDVTVLDDVTLEMTFFHQNYYLAASATAPLKSAATFGPFATSRFINDTNDSSPVQPTDASYGIVSHSTLGFTRSDGVYGAWQTDFATDTKTKTKIFGNNRLQTFSLAVVFDYTHSEEDGTKGTFYFDYFRDATPTNVTSGWEGMYDALYCGKIASQAAAHNSFWFGGNLPFAYRAIRMYSVSLTSEQMAQNHIAELFDYYRADPTLYLSLVDKPLAAARDALAKLRLGETSKEEIEQIIADCADAYYPPLYQELYVQDGLVFLWSGEGYELGETQVAVTSFDNLLGEGTIDKLTYERLSAGYYRQKALSGFSVVDKGVLSTTDSKLYLTDIIPTKVYEGENILSDMTLEVAQSYPKYYKTSVSGTQTAAKRNFDTGCIYLGPEGFYNYTKVASGAILYGGKYYAVYQYTPNGASESETVYTPVDPSSTKQPFTLYRMTNGVLTEAEDIQNMYLVEKDGSWVMHEDATGSFEPALTTHGHRQTTRLLPAFDAYGTGPIENWSSGIQKYLDNPVNNTPQFLNAQIDEIFTATFRFDYDDAFTAASAIDYALTLYRDGANVYSKNSTYSADTDYTDGYNTYSGVLYADDTYTLNEETGKYEKTAVGQKYGFTYGLSSTMIYHGIRLYDRALTDAEIAQNHFIDLAFAYDAGLKDYLALDDAAKARIHTLFADSSTLDFTKESFEAALAEYIAADGFYLAEGFDAVLGFEGFSGRLWDKESVRAIFTADMSLVEKLEKLGAAVEIGVMVAPYGDSADALTVTYAEDGTPTPSRGLLRTAYLTGDEQNALKDTDDEKIKSMVLSLVLDDPHFTLELASELVVRAYVTVKNAKTPYVHYFEAESELFGASISFTELYRLLYMSDYESYPIVKEVGGDLAELLGAVEEELVMAAQAQNAALDAADALKNAMALYEACRAALPDTVADAYLVLSNAYTAYVAANAAESTLYPSLCERRVALENALATLEDAIAEKADEDTARLITYRMRKTVAELTATAALYENADLYCGTDDVDKYLSAFEAIDPEASVSLNGKNLSEFVLLPDRHSYYAAKTLALALYEAYGILPLTVLSGIESAILSDDTVSAIVFSEEEDDFGSWSIEASGNAVVLSGGGENGAYRAANELLARIKDGEITLDGTLSSADDETLSEKKFAADKFLRPDGTLDTQGTEPLTVTFIGGSLTELTDTKAELIDNWRLQVSNYLESLFPNRELTFYNVGIGGTTSYAGATRFGEHVAKYNPDIIFIEFTVNDQMSGYSELEAQTSMESILYQCAQLETIPSVIYTHNPYATYPDSSLYRSWYKQVEYKEEWAAHYDISTTNVYDYIYRQYEISYEEGTANDFIYFLDTYYGSRYTTESQYGWYDVHGGYKWYADAIIENLAANAAEMLRPFRMGAYLNPDQTNIIEASYNYIRHDSDRFTYSNGEEDGNTADDWKVYTKENHAGVSVYGENTLAERHWNLPGFTAGIRQISGSNGAYFEFRTTASKIVVHDQLSRVGAQYNNIYVVDADGNETKVGYSSCKSSYVQPSIQSRPIDLQNPDHEEILVRIRIEDSITYYRDGSDTKFTTTYDEEKHASVTPVYSTFRFGGIIEIFD